YRSSDAGESWQRVESDGRLWGRGSDFAEVKVDPKNPDVVYVANVVTWRSTDGGQTFKGFRGAPGGDDYHTVWISPDNSNIILLAADQGAIVTVNGGQTWSSWYNQPTAQFYHVITDNQFPYRVYGGQQESGSVGIASRGDDGQITFREWHPVGVEEYGYVAPDPLNPDIIYGGKITRYDRSTGQVQNITPEGTRGGGRYRFLRTAPVIFSPVDPHILFFAGNVLFKTLNGGNSWEVISPDLSRETPEVPGSIGVFRTPDLAGMARRGVIYTVAPSHKDVNVIWAGTDDGLIHLTRDGGKSWTNVTPPGLTAWSKVSILDAGRFDADTAYAAINRIRLDDQRPHIYRTHDGGRTWKEIVRGLPENAPVNAVREDPVRRGMLFCGTELAVHVSFNDGDDWQPLRLNMPATSIRDLVVHDDDIVVGTHGRSFWILDDITPLRQVTEQVAASDAFLFKPQLAYRVRWNMNTDTPLPQEEPSGKNPPDGAIINYYLKSPASGPVVLEVFDSSNRVVRRFSSDDRPERLEAIEKQVNIPTYWIRPPQVLSAEVGMQRFVWDLHYSPLDWMPPQFPIAAIYRDTPRHPLGPWAMPGSYSVKLTVNGRSYTQTLNVKMDPRVKTLPADLGQQHAIAMRSYEGLLQVRDAQVQTRKLREQIKNLRERAAPGPLADALSSLDSKLTSLEGAGGGPRGGGGRGAAGGGEPSLNRMSGELLSLMGLVEGADVRPTTQAVSASEEIQKRLSDLVARWLEIKDRELKSLNGRLREAQLTPLTSDR
ncbi:MAG TPA: glycoside hydrolase, partial [Blastocatellia bacterium]|nr:glycoside hydrolase [Blastocatellia bacterium]